VGSMLARSCSNNLVQLRWQERPSTRLGASPGAEFTLMIFKISSPHHIPHPQQLTYHPAAALRAASPTHSSSACSWCSPSLHWCAASFARPELPKTLDAQQRTSRTPPTTDISNNPRPAERRRSRRQKSRVL